MWTDERALRWTDYLLLMTLCAVWGLISLVDGRTLTSHETTHCQNVREMFEDRQFLIATYGRRPWLERPSVPHLLTGIPASIVADCATPWAMRFSSMLAGCAAVLAIAWAMAGAMGRTFGLMCGCIFATFREFAAYSTGPEADIYLAMAVTIAGSLFIRSEFGPNGAKPEWGRLFGTRPWAMLLMYAVIGLTNAMKGPLFGTAFLALAMAAYCFLGRNWAALSRYVTVWGWLIYFAVALIWPLISMSVHPDVPDVWKSDYGKRWDGNYVGEPRWYYLVHVPWNLFPWTIPAMVGLGVTAKEVFKNQHRFWQFIWAWALVPPIVLSAFQGKHHHYMLNCIAPWSALSLVGAVAIWQHLLALPRWRRSVVFNTLGFGLPAIGVIMAFRHKIPGPTWIEIGVCVLVLLLIATTTYAITRPNGRMAFGGVMVIFTLAHQGFYLGRTLYADVYRDDLHFLREVPKYIPADATLFVLNEPHVLNASWLLYYEPHPTKLLHNITYLASEQIMAPVVYLLARKQMENTNVLELLRQYGEVRVLLTSEKTRAERSPDERYTLFKLTFRRDLKRHPEPPMSALQALGRASGPELPKP